LSFELCKIHNQEFDVYNMDTKIGLQNLVWTHTPNLNFW